MKCEGCDRAKNAATKTLERIGYTYHGGEEWKPPLGEKPEFSECVFCGAGAGQTFYGKPVCLLCVNNLRKSIDTRR